MKKIKLLEQFLEELGYQKIEEGLFDVVTKSKAFIKNPISATKITNNGKKLAQAQVDTAANDLDFEKRKLAANKAAKAKIEALKKKGDSDGADKVKDDFDDSKDVLKAAHDQKEEALKDKVGSIGDRIEDLSKKNSTLQDLASLVKTAARVKKNEVLLKGADDEEKKQLKLQMKQDTERIEGLQKGFSDYEGSGDEESEAKPEGKKKEVGVDTGSDPKPAKPAGSTPPPPPPPPPPADKPLTTTSAPKAPAPKAPEPSNEDPADAVARTRQDVSDQQRIIADHKGRIKGNEDKIADLKAGKFDKKKVTDPQAEIAKLQKAIEAETDDMAVAKTELEDLVKSAQDAESKAPKAAPADAPSSNTKEARIEKLEKEIKAAEEENEKIMQDPRYLEGKKTNDEKKALIDKANQELDAINKEGEPDTYAKKMKEIQDLVQDRNDFQAKWSEDNKDLEDKKKEGDDRIKDLRKDLQTVKDEADEAPKESLTMLKSFKDFVTEKNKS